MNDDNDLTAENESWILEMVPEPYRSQVANLTSKWILDPRNSTDRDGPLVVKAKWFEVRLTDPGLDANGVTRYTSFTVFDHNV